MATRLGFAGFDLAVVADDAADFAGPLAGILAALVWARGAQPETAAVLTVPADTPFLPRDLAARLAAAGAPAMAASGGRIHPVVGLWPLALEPGLRKALREEGLRKVEEWTARLGPAVVDFASVPRDPFFNVNTPEDLARLPRYFEKAPSGWAAMRATRSVRISTLPMPSKLTVTRGPVTDWTWPRPQSGRSGWRTKAPGARNSDVNSDIRISISDSGGECSGSLLANYTLVARAEPLN